MGENFTAIGTVGFRKASRSSRGVRAGPTFRCGACRLLGESKARQRPAEMLAGSPAPPCCPCLGGDGTRTDQEDPQRRSRDEIALNVEGVVDGGMHAAEALSRSSRLEALHFALSSPHRLMRILAAGLVADGFADDRRGARVVDEPGGTLVGLGTERDRRRFTRGVVGFAKWARDGVLSKRHRDRAAQVGQILGIARSDQTRAAPQQPESVGRGAGTACAYLRLAQRGL